MTRHLRPFLELLSRYTGYAFDDTDWDAVESGVRDTDDEYPDHWYAYPLAGKAGTLEIRVAHAVGSDVTSVSVTGRGHRSRASGPTRCCRVRPRLTGTPRTGAWPQ